jgi:hypothetical protein
MAEENSILILLNDKNIAFIPENNILSSNYKKPYIKIFFSYEKIRFKCKEAKQHFYSQSDNYDNLFIEENMIKILCKENHACYYHPNAGILFYCLIWTFNTFLFYKKVLKPKLNL